MRFKSFSKRRSGSATLANHDATPSIECYRLIILFFETTPDINQIDAAVDTLP